MAQRRIQVNDQVSCSSVSSDLQCLSFDNVDSGVCAKSLPSQVYTKYEDDDEKQDYNVSLYYPLAALPYTAFLNFSPY